MYQYEINKISKFSARNHNGPKNEALSQCLGLWAVSGGEDSSSVVKHGGGKGVYEAAVSFFISSLFQSLCHSLLKCFLFPHNSHSLT